MDQSKQCTFFLVFLLGCTTVLATKTPCNNEELETCSKPLAEVKDTKPETICQEGLLDTALKCWQDLEAKCELTEEQQKTANHSVKSIHESKEGCDDPSKITTCGDSVVMKCHDLHKDVLNLSPNASHCGPLDKVVMCLNNALTNCLNDTTKTSLTALQTEVKKNMTSLECCDTVGFEKCGNITKYEVITNATATAELCKTTSTNKECLTTELSTCGDKAFKMQYEKAVEVMNGGLEICENKGFLEGASTVAQPALALLLATFLVTLSKFF